MHHVQRKRKTQNAASLSEVADLCGVSVGSIQWHKLQGRIPNGEIEIDQYRFYSRQQVEELKSFFRARKRYQHMK